MRLNVSITCLVLVGLFASEGEACQILPLPPLDDSVVKQEEQDTIDVPRFQSVPVIKPPIDSGRKDPKTLNRISNVFEDALSQFPDHRVARLPASRQESAPIIETSRYQPGSSNSIFDNAPGSPAISSTADPTNQFKTISSRKQVGPFGTLEVPENTPFIGDSEPINQSFAPMSTTESLPSIEPNPEFKWEAPQTMVVVPSSEGSAPSLPLESLSPMRAPSPMASPVPPKSQPPVMARDESTTWWKTAVLQPIDGTRAAEPVDSNGLVFVALQNSPRIQAVSQNPLIRELQIVEADAEFDPVRFLTSQFEDRVDPVGNSLTVGNGESFLKDNIWSADLGLRKKARNGANWELNQRLGFQNSNSNFFVPQDQGTATLALNVTQPLLRGRGEYVNSSQILIAQATNGAAWHTFHAELQDELLGVMSAYWDLYLSRSVYLQKRRNVERGQKILTRLEGRAGLDSLPSQIARARSSVQTRRTELANAMRDVKNAETEVRRRVADNSWVNGGGSELIPGELPSASTFQLPLEQVVYAALEHRPEVSEAMQRARIASIQRDVSANDLLPELSLLLGTYVSSLRGDTGIGNAFQDQFGQVKPGYSVGINFELPYGNRSARSRLAQRQLQAKKIRAEVDEVMQTVIAESQVALRRVESASETLIAANEAIVAAIADRNQFERRWDSFALVEGDLADGQNPTNVLDQLLDSQDRLASAELIFVQAERELKVAEVSLQRAMGTLLMTQNVGTMRSFDADTPRIDLFKNGNAVLPSTASGIPTAAVPQIGAAPAGFNQFPQ